MRRKLIKLTRAKSVASTTSKEFEKDRANLSKLRASVDFKSKSKMLAELRSKRQKTRSNSSRLLKNGVKMRRWKFERSKLHER